MLQDFEVGRRLELEPVVGVLLELGERLGVATPLLRCMANIVGSLDRQG
jgi:ketopantoate reductase